VWDWCEGDWWDTSVSRRGTDVKGTGGIRVSVGVGWCEGDWWDTSVSRGGTGGIRVLVGVGWCEGDWWDMSVSRGGTGVRGWSCKDMKCEVG